MLKIGGLMVSKKFFTFLLFNLLFVVSAYAQIDITYKGYLYNHGEFRDSWVVGSRLYTITERQLMIYDITDTSNPVLLGTLETQGKAQAVRTSGNYAYVIDEENGLLVINVSNPSTPVVTDTISLGSYPLLYSAFDRMKVVGNYLYVAKYYGLKIFSIFNPAVPVARDSIFFNSWQMDNVEDFEVYGNYAYISQNSDSGIFIIDVSNPDSIFRVSSIYPDAHTYGIEIKDTVLYAAVGYPHGLKTINITDPLNPVVLGYYDAGSYLFYDVKVVDTLAFCYKHGGKMIILNVKNPVAIDSVAQPLSYGGGEGTIDIFNNLMLMTSDFSSVTGYISTLHFLNISDKLTPLEYSSISNDRGPIGNIAVYGNKLAILNVGELLIHDISDPINPVFLGKYNSAASEYPVAIGPKCMYYIHNWQQYGIRAISLKDYSLIATFPRTLNGFCDLAYSKGNVIAKRDTLFIFDDTLHVVGYLPDTGITEDIYVQGDSVYGYNQNTGNFDIFDISDRANPLRVGSYPGNIYMVRDFVVVDSLTYFLYAYGNLSYVKSYRRDNSLGMVGVDSIALEKNMAYRIGAQGKYLYVSTYDYIITILINPDNSMTEISRYNTSGKPRNVAFYGQYFYLGDTYSVGIYEFQIPLAPKLGSMPDTSTAEDSTYNYIAAASGSPAPSYSLITCPSGMTIDSISGEVTWNPDNSNVGDTVISVVATNTVSSDTQSFNLHVLNTPPHFTSVPDTEVVFPESTYTYDAESDDEGQGNTVYKGIMMPSWLTLDSLTGLLNGKLPDSSLNAMVSLIVDDGNGGVDSQNFVIAFVGVEEQGLVPIIFEFKPIEPNPVMKTANIKYALPKESRVSICAYNICGQKVSTIVNEKQKAGYYTKEWNPINLPAGAYFIKFSSKGLNKTEKIILTK